MSPQISGKKEFTLLQLLTEVGAILIKIKENSKTDITLPKEPLKLLDEVLSHSKTKEELQINLKLALGKQKLNVDALIDYVTTLSLIRGKEIPIDKFKGDHRFSK